MASLVVIDITNGPKVLLGHLQRIMLEIRPGTFVWRLSSKKTKELWNEIISHKCSAVCVFAAKNEAGFVIATHGKNRREVVFNHGFPLVKYTKPDNAT